MCGIAGLYSIGTIDMDNLRVVATRMTDALAHRGPDGAGIWIDQNHPLALGHRRLSILDLSPTGAQPMHSGTDRYTMTYNGEIYNAPEMHKQLEARGYTFRGTSDTEVILSYIEEFGFENALKTMHGMFALAVWDKKTRTLHLARDRFGKKPLYIGWAGKDLVFASELKAFKTHPDFTGEIDPLTLSNYLQYGYINAPRCIYKGVWTLLPAHSLTLDLSSLTPGENIAAHSGLKPYWPAYNLAKQDKINMTETEAITHLEGLLKKSVQGRMIADVPLGAFLSGGIDSSTIVALMQKHSAKPVDTFTIDFDVQAYSEADHARNIAKHLGTNHHELKVTSKDALAVVPDLPIICDEPFSDISVIPTVLLSKLTREHVTVALSGDGGDELFGGYSRHTHLPSIWNTLSRVPAPLRPLISGTGKKIPTGLFSLLNHDPQFPIRIEKLKSALSAHSYQELYSLSLSRWPNPPLCKDSQPSPQNTFWSVSFDDAPSTPETLMLADTLGYLPDNVLVKVDRSSMAQALEARAPFLDPRVFEFAWQLPLDLKIRHKQGKWIIREILKKHVPASLFERPKQGFVVPIDSWLRSDLKDWAEDLLSEEALAEHSYFDAETIRQSWSAHKESKQNNAIPLWTILMFQAWIKAQ